MTAAHTITLLTEVLMLAIASNREGVLTVIGICAKMLEAWSDGSPGQVGIADVAIIESPNDAAEAIDWNAQTSANTHHVEPAIGTLPGIEW